VTEFRYGLHARVIAAHALCAIALSVLAATARTAFGLGEWYLPKAAGLFALGTLVCLRYVGRYHPFDRYGPANQVTLIRGAFVALLAGLIGETPTASIAACATAVAVAIAALDGVDGWSARRSGMSSAFGARFDMETDSALVLVLAVLAWQHGKAGGWVLLCGLMRYLFVAGGWLLPWLRGRLEPTLRGKTIAVVQVLALSVTLVPVVRVPLSTAVAALALLTLTWSFALDVGRLWRSRS
jgi:phosphatidylglycerophosphate synthase